MLRSSYAALAAILLLCAVALILSFLSSPDNSKLPAFNFTPGYYEKINRIGIARIVPISGPILINPTADMINEEEFSHIHNNQNIQGAFQEKEIN